MAANIQGLFSLLDKAQDQIVNAIVTLDSLSKELKQFDGEIATNIPLHLKANIEKLTNIIEGQEDSSLAKLSDYLNNTPISMFRDKKIIKAKPIINASFTDESNNEVSDDGIDITPDLSNGPMTAVAKANGMNNGTEKLAASILDKYLKNGSSRIKENVLSIDIALSDEDIGDDYVEGYEDSDYSGSYFNDNISDDDEFTDEVSDEDEFDENDSSDWRTTNQEFNPDEEKSLDFNSIVSNKDLVNIDDDDTDLVGKFNSENIPFDDMSDLVSPPSTAPVDNSDEFTQDTFEDVNNESGETFEEDEEEPDTDWRSLIKGGDIDFGTISGAGATDGI